jgi:tetratricopeptide (TPR) repeat protein
LSNAIGVKTKGDLVMDLNHINKALETKEEKYDVAAGTLFYTRGISFYYARNLQKALHDFNFCIRNSYRLGSCYFYRGAIFEEMNLKDSACEDFMKSKFYGNADVDEYIGKYCK